MKNIIRLILLVGIVLFLQNCSNDYKKAQSFVDAGNYKAFYSEISQDVKNGNNQAKNLLIDYFFKAIQDGNEEEVQYYLQKQPSLINMIDTDGNRAIDVVLFDEIINLSMFKILLQYNPKLNYIVKFYDMSPLQVVVSGKYDNVEVVNLLLQNGVNINFIGNSNTSNNTPLILSYVTDKINVFAILVKSGAKLDNQSTNNNIFAKITASYALYLKQQGIDLNSFYTESISKKILKTISSIGYEEINNKNMQYLETISIKRNMTSDISASLVPLIKWYIKTNNYNGLKYIINHRLCTDNEVCIDMKQFAVKKNNRAALYILNKIKDK